MHEFQPPINARALVRVLDHDEDLASVLDPASREHARGGAVAPLVEVPRGAWQPPTIALDPRRDLGLLVLSGLLTRDQHVAGRTFTELRGPEDLLRPWDEDAEVSSIRGRVSWTALQPTTMAWLERIDRGAWLLLGGVPDGVTDIALPTALLGFAKASKDSRQALQ